MGDRIALGIFTFAAVAFGGLEIYGVTEHTHDPTWPHHAQFHAVTGLFDELLLCVFTLILAWGPLKKGRAWAWWTLAAIGFSLFGGLLIGNVFSHGGLTGGGESLGHPQIFTYLAVAAVLLWALALALSYRMAHPTS